MDGDGEEKDEEEDDGFVVFDIRDKGKISEEFLFSLFLKNNKIIDC